MIAPFLPTHDATTVALDFGVFIAEHARTYRTSQTAIIAALLPIIEPDRHHGDDRPLTPDAVERLIKAIDELPITPSQPVHSSSHAPAADTPAPLAGDTTGAEVQSSSLASAPVETITESAAPATTPVKPTGPQAKHAVEGALSSGPGEVQGYCDLTSPTPSPLPSDPADGAGIPPNRAPTPSAAFSPASPKRGRPETVRSKIVACHHANPSWPSKLIAQHLDISEDAVRATASRKKLKLVSWWDYQRAVASHTAAALMAEVAPKPAGAAIDRVKAVFDAHPEWDTHQIASAAQCSYSTASIWVQQWRNAMRPAKPQEPAERAAPPTPRSEPQLPPVKTPTAAIEQPEPKRATLADQIRAHLVDHPDATLKDVTDAIGGKMQAVGWAAQKAGITLRKRNAEERSAGSAKGAQAREASRALVTAPSQPIRVVTTHAPRGAGPSARFYVRDDRQRYLHQSLERSPTDTGPLMTTNRKWAWFDNAQRFAGAAAKWPEIATMTKVGPQS